MNKVLKKFLQIIFSILFWIGVWAFASFKVSNTFLLPSPADVTITISELIKTVDFWIITAESLGRILLGIVSAMIVGILLAVITANFSFFNMLVTPLMSTVKATPVASFIFIAIIFINRNSLPVFIAALLVLPIIWTNVSSGIRAVPKELKDVARVYRLTPVKRFTKLYVPSVMPFFLAACRSALGMAWKAGVAAEVLCTPKSAIGTELYFAKTYLETQTLFAWTVVTIVLSLIIEKIIIYFISRTLRNLPNTDTEVRA